MAELPVKLGGPDRTSSIYQDTVDTLCSDSVTCGLGISVQPTISSQTFIISPADVPGPAHGGQGGRDQRGRHHVPL